MSKLVMSYICPICDRIYNEYPALSRRDNKTEICPACGQKEAMEDYFNYLEKKAKEDKKNV